MIGPPTLGQSRNAAVVNTLYQLHQAVSKVLAAQHSFPAEASQHVQNALEVGYQFCHTKVPF